MTALDFTDPAAVAAEAQRRRERRAQGLPLHDQEPTPRIVQRVTARAWPRLAIELPLPRSIAREINEQREVVKVFHRFGCRCESTSQARQSKVALGISDLWVWLLPIASAGWFEVKSGTDWRFSNPQLEWAERCLTTNTPYGCGDRFAAEVFCRALGLKEI